MTRFHSFTVAAAAFTLNFTKEAIAHNPVHTLLNSSIVLTCQAQGQEPLSSCMWIRTIGTVRKLIFIDHNNADYGGWTDVDGISYAEDGLGDGKCSIMIESVTADDFGTWSCTLISNAGRVFTGSVEVGKNLQCYT